MQEESGGFRFSLSSLIKWFLVASALLGVVVFVVRFWPPGKHRPESAVTRAYLHNIQIALMNYGMEWQAFPGMPGEPSISPGVGINVHSPVKGGQASIAVDNKDQTAFLLSNQYLELGKLTIKGGHAVDAWGRPVVFRVLRVPESRPDGTIKPALRYYVWSCGEDGVNDVGATPNYTNRGAPEYDKDEVEHIEKSLKNCGDDIVITDR